MVLNTIDMNMQSLADKRLTACLLLLILELFFDGKQIELETELERFIFKWHVNDRKMFDICFNFHMKLHHISMRLELNDVTEQICVS